MATPSRASGRSVNVAQLVSLFLAFLMVAGVAGVLSAGFMMPMVAALGATTQAGVDTFEELPTDIGDLTLSERSVIQYSDGSLMATFYQEDRIVVPLEEISEQMRQAVVAVEDKRFYEHGAIDPEGMFRAMIQTLSGSDFQGGSTLTQQYVKNVLLEQGRVSADAEAMAAATAPTIGRKLREAKLAIALEQVYSKDDILAGYLNIAQFGPSQYGVEAASRYYFSKHASKLDFGEAALLAGITQAPAKYNPVENPENAKERRNTVLRLMLAQGIITQEKYDKYTAETIKSMLDVQRIPPNCAVAKKSAYFCEYIRSTILNSPEYGETRAERSQLLLRGGLVIRTTIDKDVQAEAYAALTDAVPVEDSSGVSNAISTVEPGTGRILAMVQNTPFGDGDQKGDPERTTKVNFNTDGAYGGSQGFQTGSTFKAFVLAAWLEAGHSLYDVVNGSQGQVFPRSTWNYDGCDLGAYAADYDPKNIEGIGTGQMRVLEATEDSVNTAFAYMANQLNMCDLYDLTQRLGLHVGSGTWINPDTGEDSGLSLFPSPSMVLGSNNIAPLTMAAAFATFASNGIYCEPIAIDSVKGPDGEKMEVPSANCERALSEAVASTVSYALQHVVETPGATGNAAAISGYDVAGKTGTANNDYAAWFVGYTPKIATAVWNGYSEGLIPMLNLTINGEYREQWYGGKFSAPIWHNFMTQAIDTLGIEPQAFPKPNEKLVIGERKWVPSVANMSVDQATQTLQGAGFQVAVGSSEESEDVAKDNVIRSEPGSGSLVTQGSTITLITSSGPPEKEDDADDNGDGGNGDGGGGNGGGGNGGGGNGGGGGGGNGGGGGGGNGGGGGGGGRP